MSSHEGLGYSIKKIFIILFILTAVEVAVGMLIDDPKWFKWSLLLILAAWKGGLILMYFMHMKFERFIVWSLILPTPLLVMVVLFALMPDLSFNKVRDHPVGHQLNQQGQVVDMVESRSHAAHGDEEHDDGGGH